MTLLDPDMPAQELRLHMGELTANEIRVARSAIGWANSRIAPLPLPDIEKDPLGHHIVALENLGYKTQVQVIVKMPEEKI